MQEHLQEELEENETLVEAQVEEKQKNGKKEFLRAVKYVLIAASAGIIQFGTNALLLLIPNISWWLSYLPPLVLSVLWNFTFNRKYTFKSANNVPIAMLKVALYYCVFTPCSILWGNELEKLGVHELLVTAINMVVNLVTEFLYCRFFVFGKSIDSAVKTDTENTEEVAPTQEPSNDQEE